MIRQTRLWVAIRVCKHFVDKLWREKVLRKNGLPPDLTQEDIDRLVSEFDCEPVRQIGYDHLSGWKRLGAFRLFLSRASGTSTVIYKNSIYDSSEIPALDGLPVFPGPPEFLVYACADRSLGKYLPDIFLLRRLEPAEHYQYLIEDLDQDYGPVNSRDAILTVCSELPEVYRNLENSLSSQDQQTLLVFDAAFSHSILAYAKENLGRFANYNDATQVSGLLGAWDNLSNVYTKNLTEIYERSELHPIHGDLNLTNIRLNKQDAQRLKFLDWEWAGIGGWWFDLVALLKTSSDNLEQEGLEEFLRASDMPYGDNEIRSYQWAKLQRGLFDASFFAKQILDSSEQAETKVRMENHIFPALQRATNALAKLQHLD